MTLYHQLLTILLILPFNALYVNTQETNNPSQELTILLNLKQFWSDPPPLSHWTSSSDHCTWPEITCTNGSITELRIINLNISGSIPAPICDLKGLSHLDLQFNYFYGAFPTVLYNCSALQYLDLSQNVLTDALPEDIDRLSSQLQFLNLAANTFINDIPASIGNLTSLVSLQLASNMFNGSFPEEIGNLSNLEELVLNDNRFFPQAIPDSFTKLKKIKNLWMTNTSLIGQIPDGIGNLLAMEFLDLSRNGLTGNIPSGLFLAQNLTILYLYKNRLSGPIPQTVQALKLQVLDLSNNTLTGPIPDDLGNLMGLTGLDLSFNGLSGEVPVSIGRLPRLVNVALFNNNLSGILPPDFGRYSPLERLQVSSNQLIGELPKYLCQNKVLIGVAAFENNLTGVLPDTLGECDSLERVLVYDNQLYGKIPDKLWTGSNITMLMISNNLFTGQLPDKIGPRLTTIELMNNQFSGSIPGGTLSWEPLVVFKASNNLFNGTIPLELTALTSLSTLLLDGNQLSGQLPSDFASLKSLTTLNLSSNKLSGEIPSSIGLLRSLLYLDLSRNEFSGPIPLQLNNLRLPSLNLSDNNLSGRIPGEYDNAAFDRSFLNNPGLCSDNPMLRLRSCGSLNRKSNKSSSRHVAIILSVASAVIVIIALLYTVIICRKYRNRKHITETTWKLTSFQRLNFTEGDIISSLTEDKMIGSGGSGKVYRIPITRTGKVVAVKKIWDNVLDQKLENEFLAEVRILSTVRHSNIVKLLCFISNEKSKLLVYEYMENCSLDQWLHGSKRRSRNGVVGSVYVLEWPKRLQIAIGAAKGISYMHNDCSPPIIHRDIKSSNVLLDSNFKAKIADFGLARMLIKHGAPNTMSVVAGSLGYMAPEYAQTRRVNEKIDVYSFGVILLELITGKEAHNGDERSSLAEWAWSYVREGKPIIDVVDEDVRDACYIEDISTVFKLGLICTSTSPSSRPDIKDVLQILIRCSENAPSMEKTDQIEYDVSPLLQDNSAFYSHV